MLAKHGVLLVILAAVGCQGTGPDDVSSCPPSSVAADGLTDLWSVRVPLIDGVPLVTANVVVTMGDTLRGFDPQTCALKWVSRVGGSLGRDGPPLEVAGLIVAGSGALVALEPETGAVVWRFPGDYGFAGEGTPAVSGDTVFAANSLGAVYAVAARTGNSIWKTKFDSLAIYHPTVAGDALILGTRKRLAPGSGFSGGFVIALNKRDGTERWRFPLPDSAGIPGGTFNSGLAIDGKIIIGSATSRLYALDVASGSLVWEQAPNVPSLASSGYEWAPRLLGGTLIVVRRDRVTEGRSPMDGSLLWTLNQGVQSSAPAISNGLAFFFDDSLLVVDESGQRVWSGGGVLTTSRAFRHGSVADDGTIYAVTINLTPSGWFGGLHVLKLPPPL